MLGDFDEGYGIAKYPVEFHPVIAVIVILCSLICSVATSIMDCSSRTSYKAGSFLAESSVVVEDSP